MSIAKKQKKKPKCHNCKHAGEKFKLGPNSMTHIHCNHKKRLDERRCAWDTLMEFWQTCELHEFNDYDV